MGFNKGEWSELYVTLKLLAEGKLYAATSDLEKIESICYPILSILADGNDGVVKFNRESLVRVVNHDNEIIAELEISSFVEKTSRLLKAIQAGSGSFDIPEDIMWLLSDVGVKKFKSSSDNKRDITIVVHDLFTGMKPELGFSIKSSLGSPSTILNSNKKTTNFIYKLSSSLSESEISRINGISSKAKIRDRVKAIKDSGASLAYHGIAGDVFKSNLMMVDSYMPYILSQMVLAYHSGVSRKVTDLVDYLNETNPCSFNLTEEQPFYEYKVKNLITDCALGMTSAKVWRGQYDATGGFIVVKEDGEILCYHIYNRDEFHDYLLKNVIFDSPSSSRHEYGQIYDEDGQQFFKLGFQIRFNK
jgi:hypothetical protein